MTLGTASRFPMPKLSPWPSDAASNRVTASAPVKSDSGFGSLRNSLLDRLIEFVQILLQPRQSRRRIEDQVLHLAGIGLQIVQLVHACKFGKVHVFPALVAHRLPARDARVLRLHEVLGEECRPPVFHAAFE